MGVRIGWLTDILRTIFFFIDQIIYLLIDKVYSLFIEIASTTLFTEDIINQFAGKVYALVGIFMLFKVSFSILTYIVNPDEFTDKSKGFNKLVSNILISLVLLIAVPFIFSEAIDIQRIILKDDIIPKIFSTSEINISSQNPGQGSEMALITFKTFYSGPGDTLGQIFSTDVNEKDSAGNYTYNYDLLISTAVGIVLILLLVSFCFDIALRSIKFGFLRMLAPIPIIARVDPKKGNDVFNKWVKTCVSTYLDLFMRLLAIFFAIYVIKLMQQSQFVDAVTGQTKNISGLTMVFIILGALMFAKQLPKLVEDLLGIKLSGTFTLNPLKKLEDVPVAGKPLSAMTKFGGRSAAALTELGLKSAGSFVGSIGRFADNITGNHISAFGSQLKSGYNNIRSNLGDLGENLAAHFPNLSNTLSGIADDFRSTAGGVTAEAANALGIKSAAEKFDKAVKEFDDIANNIDSILKRANGEMIKHESLTFKDNAGNTVSMRDFKIAKEYLNSLKNTDTSNMTERQLNEHLNKLNDWTTNVNKTEKLAEQAFVDAIKNGTLIENGEAVKDAEIVARLDNLTRTVRASSDSTIRAIDTSTGKGLKEGKDSIIARKAEVQYSSDYVSAHNAPKTSTKK